MTNTIKCPYCQREFEPTDALKHQMEEEINASLEKKHKQEMVEIKRKFTTQFDEMFAEIRKLREANEDSEMEMKKKLLAEEEKIKYEAKRKYEEEHKLKDLEKDKKMQDILNANEELRRKLEQGSQQTQGESLEIEIETKLKSEFPEDIITEVKKGQRGADVTQVVVDKLARKCGRILWESKNAQWSDGWIGKLKEDQRRAKADLAVLVSVNLPKDVKYYSYKNGVWICSWKIFAELAYSLRFILISIHHEKQTNIGADEKMQVLYQYLTGNEFKHRVEGIVESFSSLQEEMEREKRYFNTKWARQEKEIRKVIDHTHGMYGDLQAVIGKSLPEIASLKLESGEGES